MTRLHETAAVCTEIMAAPDEGIPQDLLEKAHCVGCPGAEAAGVHPWRRVREGATCPVGPVGRTTTAQTDAQIHTDILSWSRTTGLFAGVSPEGATLRQHFDVDE